ncbi:sigma-54 interaction domain-containing protein [Geoalkalibacter sp.]|uniref:sigma-54 interaction domain-containing protein n=1 Tax=Geoalkalibacter sp. TaxID=3041440 RepID=UPI00272EC5AD|nr:sigma 54-interacting transcriptional regulator [Geoalkalibacter sp.]
MTAASPEIFRSIVYEMQEGVIFLDPLDCIQIINPAAERIRKVRADRILGQHVCNLHPPSSHKRILELLESLKQGMVSSRNRVVSAQGRFFDNSYSAVRAPDGAYLGTLLISRDITENKTLSEENQRLRRYLSQPRESDSFIAQSPAIKAALDMVEVVATLDSTVLLTGESGTGKEHFVDILHALSPRRGAPLVKINCAALPENLIESELFGHRRGAFTGAVADQPGKFSQADGGTLFLDEIGELPLSSQAKLLRVLQEKSVQSVGAQKELRVDVRIIAATNRKLAEEVMAGRFREDLYYRLNVINIAIPPLRERREDILPLAEYFLTQFARRMERPLPRLSPQAREHLQRHPWPGNVRQLKHAMERAVALSKGEIILPDDLPEDLIGDRSVPSPGPAFHPGQSLRGAVEHFEREYLRRALEYHQGRRLETAKALGISRKNLWEKLQRLGLEDL